PGPKASLGPEFAIEVARPRDKKAMNTDENFKKVRTEVLNYLVELGEANKLSKSKEYELPDLKPMQPNSRTFPFFRKAS
ncbi:MAG: ABC transporter ATP-binding protein, partial [Bacteroidota bacterium]